MAPPPRASVWKRGFPSLLPLTLLLLGGVLGPSLAENPNISATLQPCRDLCQRGSFLGSLSRFEAVDGKETLGSGNFGSSEATSAQCELKNVDGYDDFSSAFYQMQSTGGIAMRGCCANRTLSTNYTCVDAASLSGKPSILSEVCKTCPGFPAGATTGVCIFGGCKSGNAAIQYYVVPPGSQAAVYGYCTKWLGTICSNAAARVRVWNSGISLLASLAPTMLALFLLFKQEAGS